MRGGSVSVSWVAMVLRAASAHGVQEDVILDRVKFDRRVLEDPEGRVDLRHYIEMFDVAARLTEVPELGLRAGTFVRPDLHVTGLLVLNGPTLGDVYERMCRISRFH